MNVLMTYRLQVFNTEILPQLNKYQNDKITFIVKNNYIKNLLPILIKRCKLDTEINIVTVKELLEGKIDNMQFDYIVGNPPYQGTGKADKIWDVITVKCIELLKNGGEMNMIHPGSWRLLFEKSSHSIKKINELYRRYNTTSIEIHGIEDGIRTFGASTDYDIVRLVKEDYKHCTTVITKHGESIEDLSKYSLLPNSLNEYKKIMAKEDEEKVNVLYNSAYHHHNGTVSKTPWMSPTQTAEFKYPCVYTIRQQQGVVFWYSNTNKKGHFGLPKLILKKGATSSLLDLDGEYGMTEFALGIIDTPINLLKIQKALFSKKFASVKGNLLGIPGEYINPIDGHGHMIKFLKEFRKDFWKEFYTPEMEQELINEGKLDSSGNLILL